MEEKIKKAIYALLIIWCIDGVVDTNKASQWEWFVTVFDIPVLEINPRAMTIDLS